MKATNWFRTDSVHRRVLNFSVRKQFWLVTLTWSTMQGLLVYIHFIFLRAYPSKFQERSFDAAFWYWKRCHLIFVYSTIYHKHSFFGEKYFNTYLYAAMASSYKPSSWRARAHTQATWGSPFLSSSHFNSSICKWIIYPVLQYE